MNPKDSPISSALDEGASTIDTATGEIKESAANAATSLKAIAAQESARLGEQLLDWLRRNTAMAKDAAANLREEAVAVSDRTQAYVRDEPMKSVLVAAAAGAALAALVMALSRRSD